MAGLGLRVRCENCRGTYESGISRDSEVTLEGKYQDCPHCMHANRLPSGEMWELRAREPGESLPEPLGFLNASPYAAVRVDDVLGPLRVVELREPATAFCGNVRRLHAMLILPVTIAAYARLFETLKQQAVRELAGSESDPEYNELIDKRLIELSVEWFRANDDDMRAMYIDHYGVGTFGRLSSGPIRSGSEAILIAQITGLWTAFEALAGDLWVAALNAHPNVLSDLSGKRSKSNKTRAEPEPTSPDIEQERDEPDSEAARYLLIMHLKQNDYDLSQHMGHALRHRYNFTKLERTRDAYWEAFKKHRANVVDAIMDRSLDDLNALRNVIVHKAGIADREFLRDRPQHEAFKALAMNDRVPITGPIVQALAKPVVETCVKLILAVNQWIVESRRRTKSHE